MAGGHGGPGVRDEIGVRPRGRHVPAQALSDDQLPAHARQVTAAVVVKPASMPLKHLDQRVDLVVMPAVLFHTADIQAALCRSKSR